jgi:hypothetical protein
MLLKNYFSIVIYASSFFSLSIFVLLPIELLLFGPYLFSSNPSPFAIKTVPAYLTAGLEFFALLSFIVLLFSGFKTYLRSLKASIIITISICVLFPIIYFISKYFITTIREV